MKPIDDFVKKLYSECKTDRSWIVKVANIRANFIGKGLASKKFKSTGKTESTASIADDYFLYLLVRHYKPSVVVEIGTWFGTSAAIMCQAMLDTGIAGIVYTCDKHNVYLKDNPFRPMIQFYNEMSTPFLQRLIKKGVKTNFSFVDGRLKKKNDKLLGRLLEGNICFATHDWNLEKGQLNVELMNKRIKGSEAFVPDKDKSGTKISPSLIINGCIAVVKT